MQWPLAARTGFTLDALRQLRDPHQFRWYAVALLAFVVYAYATEVERRRWEIVAAGVAVWLADWFNEIVNALVLHVSDRAALWTATGPTAYQLLVGLNVEITFMFAVAGIVYGKLLPTRRSVRLFGLPNRFAVALGLSLVSVAVELFLHATGTFHWEYWWWNTASFPVIVVFGYLWFYLFAARVHDAPPRHRIMLLGSLGAIDLAMGLVFGVGLGWL